MNELQAELAQLKLQVASLQNRLDALNSTSSIPWEIDQAFRDRFISSVPTITVSSKGVDTEDITINESGSATKVVMNDPAAFLQTSVNGVVYYIPVFTS